MKQREFIPEAWFSKKKENLSDENIIMKTADLVIDTYLKKHPRISSKPLEFDNQLGNGIRSVIAEIVVEHITHYSKAMIQAMVNQLVPDSYINFKLNGNIDDSYTKKDISM
ncbi:Uncharacterised protein [uncultured archaeon]|nr:Uncharacterised protein [uncultured archaeon]